MKKSLLILVIAFGVGAHAHAGENFYSGVCGKIVKIRNRFQARNEIKIVFDKTEVGSIVDDHVVKGPMPTDVKYMVSSSTYPLLDGERKLLVEMYYRNQIYNTLLLAQGARPYGCIAYVFDPRMNRSGIDHVATIGTNLDDAIEALKECVRDF